MDTKARSWAKAIVWRIIGIVLLGGIIYLVTRDWKEMTIVTVLFHGLRVVMYYFHERVWENISWGKVKHPLADLPVKTPLSPTDLEIIANRLKALGYIE